MPRKPRPDSNLKTLPEEPGQGFISQREVIERLKVKGGSYSKVAGWLKQEWDIDTSEGALSTFWNWWHLRDALRRREERSHDLEELLRKRQLGLSEEEIIAIGSQHFMEQGVASGDARMFAAILDRVLAKRTGETKAKQKDQELALAERRIELLEKKAAQADAAKAIVESNLSPEEQRERLREILK